MGSCIAAGAASGCTFLCCGACNRCSEAKTGAVSRIPYIFLFFLSSVFAIVMSLYGETEFGFKFYHTHVCQTDECEGNGSVFRVSFCLFIFEAIHVLIICKATAFHYLFFPFKFLFFVAILICSFVIDGLNPVFDEWGEIARIFSGFYLLIQILIFVCWSYDLNEYLRVRGDQLYEYNEDKGYTQKCCCECIPGNCYYWSLGIISIGCIIATFVCLGLFYPLYDQNNSNPHCAVHESVTSITIILAGLTATFSVVRGDGSFGVAAMITFYSTFLLFNAMQADPDNAEGHESCNLFHRSRDSLSLWIGFLITFATLFYAALRSDMMAILGKDPNWEEVEDDEDEENTDGKVKSLLTKEHKQEAILMNEDITSVQDDGIAELYSDAEKNKSNYDDAVDKEYNKNGDNPFYEDDEDTQEQLDRKANIYFHVVMMLASAYMSMLFTNWGTNKDSIDTVGTISFVVGCISSWTAMLIFWWTLLAPKLCPHRFPDYQNDE